MAVATLTEMTESKVKALVKNYLRELGYVVTKKPPMIQVGVWRRYPDVYAQKEGKVLIVECKGGKEKNFYSVINALGQVLAIKSHYPNYDIAISIPSYWGEDCLSDTIRRTYRIRLLMANTFLQLVTEVKDS
jgi:hypothetical protein